MNNLNRKPEAPQGPDEPAADIATAMARVKAVVGQHFPEALDPVKAALAVAAVGCLKDNEQPTTLIFVAPASAGKSMALNFMMPVSEKDPLAAFFYRSDKFTAASFVSHRADTTEKKLRSVDLLPRLEKKTLLTKELAPMFAGRRDELTERFAVLTAVLDGKGYVSDSGAHGRRGYLRPINFQWLGATTPLSPEVLAVMATLGPRMLFYDADRPRQDTEALVALARRANDEAAKRGCQAAVCDFLLQLYTQSPPGSIDSSRIVFEEGRLRLIALWAQVVVALRATVQRARADQYSLDGEVVTGVTVEHPERVLGILRNVAIGSALAHGRGKVNDYDLAQVAHIALSSGVQGRQMVFRAVLTLGGSATTPQIEAAAGLAAPTVRRHMEDLKLIGLARLERTPGSAARIALVEPFTELCSAPPLKAKRGEAEQPC